MAVTPSNMVPLRSKAHPFTLLDVVSGTKKSYEELREENGVVIMFICNHCPFVKHINQGLVRVANQYQKKGIRFVAISSNDAKNYPEDSPENMKEVAKKQQYPFVYLYDETQEVAKKYKAACTPDFFVYDSNDELFYRGQLDESRPGNDIPVTTSHLQEALNKLLAGEQPPEEQIPSAGCGIKWKN
ncbi:MAG: thioredoxin family protein [Candidatus Woesearchaeota archaeon]